MLTGQLSNNQWGKFPFYLLYSRYPNLPTHNFQNNTENYAANVSWWLQICPAWPRTWLGQLDRAWSPYIPTAHMVLKYWLPIRGRTRFCERGGGMDNNCTHKLFGPCPSTLKPRSQTPESSDAASKELFGLHNVCELIHCWSLQVTTMDPPCLWSCRPFLQ